MNSSRLANARFKPQRFVLHPNQEDRRPADGLCDSAGDGLFARFSTAVTGS
jgi:hypothetical protein